MRSRIGIAVSLLLPHQPETEGVVVHRIPLLAALPYPFEVAVQGREHLAHIPEEGPDHEVDEALLDANSALSVPVADGGDWEAMMRLSVPLLEELVGDAHSPLLGHMHGSNDIGGVRALDQKLHAHLLGHLGLRPLGNEAIYNIDVLLVSAHIGGQDVLGHSLVEVHEILRIEVTEQANGVVGQEIAGLDGVVALEGGVLVDLLLVHLVLDQVHVAVARVLEVVAEDRDDEREPLDVVEPGDEPGLEAQRVHRLRCVGHVGPVVVGIVKHVRPHPHHEGLQVGEVQPEPAHEVELQEDLKHQVAQVVPRERQRVEVQAPQVLLAPPERSCVARREAWELGVGGVPGHLPPQRSGPRLVDHGEHKDLAA
mmetsp:Transcript_32432/g.50509  ORF Transcript_32432/g.50509 Transcript_32432/m.50509 type:complete len:368 (-) Transcript_32432:137-1240(-)